MSKKGFGETIRRKWPDEEAKQADLQRIKEMQDAADAGPKGLGGEEAPPRRIVKIKRTVEMPAGDPVICDPAKDGKSSLESKEDGAIVAEEAK